jgi:microcystin-dependent protein
MADGASYTQADYPDAYAMAQAEVAAGNTLWTVTGTTFTVPNLTDRFIYSRALAHLGGTGGAATHQLTAAESGLPDHTHASAAPPSSANTWQASNVVTNVFVIQVLNTGTGGVVGGAKNAAQAHNNMPPYVVVGQIVKLRGVTISGEALVGPAGPPGEPGIPADPTPLAGWQDIPYGPNWSHGGVAARRLQYRLDPFGKVLLRGYAQNSAVFSFAGSNNLLGTLPAEARPPADGPSPVPFDSIGFDGSTAIQGHGRLEINPSNGEIRIVGSTDSRITTGAVGSSFWLNEIEFDTNDVLTFPVGPAGPQGPPGDITATAWTRVGAFGSGAPVAFGNSLFTHYDFTTWGPVEYRKVGDEVQIRGSLKTSSGVTPGASSNLLAFGEGWRPQRHATFPHPYSTGAASYLYVSATTFMLINSLAYPGNWVPLDHVRFSTAPATTS